MCVNACKSATTAERLGSLRRRSPNRETLESTTIAQVLEGISATSRGKGLLPKTSATWRNSATSDE